MTQTQNVLVGQVWGDKDKRRTGRTFKVVNVTNKVAVCEILSKATSKSRSRRKTNIKLTRFRPKYYVLEKNVTAATSGLLNTLRQPQPPQVDTTVTNAVVVSTLQAECEAVLHGSWGSFGNWAVLNNNGLDVIVRRVRYDCHDVKARIDGHLIYSHVTRSSATDAMNALKDQLEQWRDTMTNVVKQG